MTPHDNENEFFQIVAASEVWYDDEPLDDSTLVIGTIPLRPTLMSRIRRWFNRMFWNP